MAYYQDSEDPYGSYDPQAPLDPYVTEEESFEFYDEGSDPYGEDGLFLSDGLDEYPEDGMEYDEYDDEMYEEEGDGMMYEDDLLFQDDWLPLPPEEIPIETLPIELRPEDYGSQLLIGGLQHPDPASMRDSYCQFYPEACLEGAGLSGREPFNRTEVAEELDRTLKDIDMTGLAIAAVLILILLFGLHYGGATETPAAPTELTPEEKIKSRLKAAGYRDADLAKRVKDIMKMDEAKREPEIQKAIENKYKSRLKDAGITEPQLAEHLAAIMAKPEKEREAKFRALTGSGSSSKSAADKADEAQYGEMLKTAGLRGDARTPKLKEIMDLPADKREEKCKEIIAALKSGAAAVPSTDEAEKAERTKYGKKLSEAGIRSPGRAAKVEEIMAEPADKRDAKCQEIIDAAKSTSAGAAGDPNAADEAKYKGLLQTAGIEEPRLTRKTKDVMKLPAAERDAACKAIIDAHKAASTSTTAKPMTAEELDVALKKYIPDDAKRATVVASLKTKPHADQLKGIDHYKKAKEESDKAKADDKDKADKDKEEKKKELTTKLQGAGVKDPKTLESEVKRITPMAPADQATEIGKIKATNDAKKASEAAAEAKEALRVALDKELKEAGYLDDNERASRVKRLMALEGSARDDKKKEYIDAKKAVGKGTPSAEATAAAKVAEDAVTATATAAKKASLEEALKNAGYTDQKEIDRMVKEIMKLPDEKAQTAKLEDYKSRKAKSEPTESLEEKAKKQKKEEDTQRADLDKKLLGAKYTDKTDRDSKVDKLMKIKDPVAREAMLTDYLGRKPGSRGGPPADPANPVDPANPADPSGSGTKALDKEEIERQLREKGYKDPKAIKYITDQVLAKKSPKEQADVLKHFTGVKDVAGSDDKYAKRQDKLEKDAAGVVPGTNPSDPASSPPLPDADFKKKLEALGYTAPVVDNMMKKYTASTPAEKNSLSKTLLTDDAVQQKANEDTFIGKVEPGKNAADPNASQVPKTEEEFRQALVDAGYTDPALANMIYQYKAAKDDKAKLALDKELLGRSQPTRNDRQKKYADPKYAAPAIPGASPDGASAMTKAALDAKLKDIGYNEAARKRMTEKWEKETNPDKKKELEGKLLNPGNKPAYEKRYNDDGRLEITPKDKADLDAILKTRGYDDATRNKMIEAWEKAKNVDRDIIYPQITSEDKAKIANNKIDYGPGGTGAPPPTDAATMVDTSTFTELPSDEDILKLLNDAGWTDPDAQRQLLSRIKDKNKSPQEQLDSFKGYTKKGTGNEKRNKEHGDKWRAEHPAGGDPIADPSKLPTDAEILEQLKKAGWTDSDARKFLLDRIKYKGKDRKDDPKKTLAAQLTDLADYTRPGRGTEDLNKQYGDKWRSTQKADPALTAEEQKLDDRLKAHGYTPDARRKMLSELRDPANKDNQGKMMEDWENKTKAEVDAINKKKGNEQAIIDVAKDAKKRGVEPAKNANIPDPNSKGPKGTTPSGATTGTGGGSSEPWLTGPQLMLLGLLLIPIFLVLSRGMTTPSGQSMLRMPSLPALPVLRGPWSSPPIMAGGIPVSTGLPELASKRKTKTRKTASSIPRMAVSHEKGGSGGSVPAININNVNAQGRDIPIDINSGSGGGSGSILGAVMEEVVVTEETMVEDTVVLEAVEEVVLVEEHVVVVEEEPIITVMEEEEEPIVIELRGPSDPNRLFWMAISLIVIAIPLLIDYSSDWPERTLSENEYLSSAYHWVVLAIAMFFLFLRLDRAYHWTTRYGRPFVRVTRRLPGMITPAIVGTVEGTERLIWGVDDAVFGKSQEMLGLVLASAAFLVAAMSEPHDAMDKGEYTEGSWQFMPLLAIGFVTFLFHNASASVYY